MVVNIGARIASRNALDDVFTVVGCLHVAYNGSAPLSEALTYINNVYDTNNALIDAFSNSKLDSLAAEGRVWVAVNDMQVMLFSERDVTDIVFLD